MLREEVYEEDRFTGFAAKAEVSITSYVVAGDMSRPVTFAFNGGPAAPACDCTSGCSAHDGC